VALRHCPSASELAEPQWRADRWRRTRSRVVHRVVAPAVVPRLRVLRAEFSGIDDFANAADVMPRPRCSSPKLASSARYAIKRSRHWMLCPGCDLTPNDPAVRDGAPDEALELIPCSRRQHLRVSQDTCRRFARPRVHPGAANPAFLQLKAFFVGGDHGFRVHLAPLKPQLSRIYSGLSSAKPGHSRQQFTANTSQRLAADLPISRELRCE
jgi:hypothetical protein